MKKMEDEETNDVENKEIIFFLGAGASVTAGVPDTESFVYGDEGFKKQIEDKDSEEEKNALQAILNILEKRNKETSQKYRDFPRQIKDKKKSEEFERIKFEKEKFEKIDVELVLETLYKLNNKGVEILPDFYDETTLKFEEKEESLKSLEKELRGFIREKTIVSEDKIDYLAPLKEFINKDKYKTLDIFSVNYDTCIEQFCKEYSLRYTDGFELYWHPGLFENDYDVKLYKIHGSVMWYLTDRGTYVKIPIASNEEDEIELITGETAKTLMVYPMGGKWEYAEPLLELIRRLHVGLENAGVCIVIGYSFRDDYIRRIFFEAAQKNKDLTIFLISPDAGKIYDDKLKIINKDKGKPSPLEGRVICWNYPIKNVLMNYYLYRSLGTLVDIQTLSNEADKIRRESGSEAYKSKLEECVSKCIEIGYTSKAEDILDKELGITLDNLKESSLFVDENNDKLRVYCGLGVNHLYGGHYDKAKRYFKELKSVLEQSLKVGNAYFDLHRQLTTLKESQDEERKDTESKLNEIERKYSNLLYEWFMHSTDFNWIKRLQQDFIDFSNKEAKLRYTTKKQGIDDILIHDILSEIIEKCEDMVRCLEIPFKEGIYKDSDIISIYEGNSVEIARKEEAEKKLKEILKAFGKLIDFCEEKERQTLEHIRD
jgi:hypothetical protein